VRAHHLEQRVQIQLATAAPRVAKLVFEGTIHALRRLRWLAAKRCRKIA
jgi:hypothetical protein